MTKQIYVVERYGGLLAEIALNILLDNLRLACSLIGIGCAKVYTGHTQPGQAGRELRPGLGRPACLLG